MQPIGFGDPIDPNEQFSEPPEWSGLQVAPSYQPAQPYPVDQPYVFAPPYTDQGFNLYAYYGQNPSAAQRPGEAVAAPVLSLITASLLLVTGFVVIFAASALDADDT